MSDQNRTEQSNPPQPRGAAEAQGETGQNKVQGEPRAFEASRPGVLGDGTEEQNLGQEGDPSARITEEEVQDAFHGAGAGEARPQGADARSAASGAETYDPDAIEVNRSRQQGLGMGQQDMDRQKDPTGGSPEPRD